MKRILVLTDFSNNAYAALLYASRLYAKETLKVTLLHSYEEEPDPGTHTSDVDLSSKITKHKRVDADNKGKALIAQIQKDVRLENHAYEMIVTPISLPSVVNTMISEEGIDLVVIGSKGRSSIEDVIVGSNTMRLTESIIGCPLFIVPFEIHFILPAKIAFSTDYNEFYPLSKLKPLTRLVRHFRSEIDVVHVGSKNDLTERQKENYDQFGLDLSEYDAEFHFVPRNGTISNALHNFTDSNNIDLFALVYHKHAFLKKLFREPVVSRIGKHKSVPTLIIPVR